jgi:hypothetical protein
LALQRLEKIWEGLMRIDRFGHYARQAQLSPLRSALRDYVLVYRTPAYGATVRGKLPAP